MSGKKQNLYLISNASTQDHESNRRSNFTNDLPSQYAIKKNAWNVGIHSIIMDNSFGIVPPAVLAQAEHIILAHVHSRKTHQITFNSIDNIQDVKNQLKAASEHILSNLIGPPDIVIKDENGVFQFYAQNKLYLAVEKNTAEWFKIPVTKYMKQHSRNFHGRHYYLLSSKSSITFHSDTLDTPYYPKQLNIHLNEIEPRIVGTDYSKRIASVPYRKKDSEKLVYEHTFEETESFELADVTTSVFKVSLTNERGYLLNLSTGQPTILALKLTEKMSQKFVVTLKSDSSLSLFPNNTNASFRVALPGKIRLKGTWEVALSSCQLSSDISLTSHMDDSYFIKLIYHGSPTLRIDIGNEPVFTTEEFLALLNKRLTEQIATGNWMRFGQIVTFSMRPDGQIGFHSLSVGVMLISRPLATSLGFSAANRETGSLILPVGTSHGNQAIIGRPKLNVLIPQAILVYTDFTAPVIVGNKYAPILKVLPHKILSEQEFKEPILYEPKNLNYIRVNREYLDQLHVSMRDVTGKEIDFEKDGVTSINLVFQKMTDK